MKKALIIFLFIFLAAFELVKADLIPESATGLHFRKITFSEALQLAKMENKLIFLYLNAPWCGPCIQLKMTTFRSKAVGDEYNPSFINISLNAEKGDGPDLALKYQIRGYPSFLFINSDGKVIYRTNGFFNAKSFTELGGKVYELNQRAIRKG